MVVMFLVERNARLLLPFITSCNIDVQLADNATSQHIVKVLTVPVSFNENGTLHSASVSFYVFETSGNDMIIGLPDIVRISQIYSLQ
jgi:hypothetical protein